jgi:hypothetical protein
MEVENAVSSRALGVCTYLYVCGFRWLATDARDGTVYFIWPEAAKSAIQNYYNGDPLVDIRAVLRARAVLHAEIQRVVGYDVVKVKR